MPSCMAFMWLAIRAISGVVLTAWTWKRQRRPNLPGDVPCAGRAARPSWAHPRRRGQGGNSWSIGKGSAVGRDGDGDTLVQSTGRWSCAASFRNPYVRTDPCRTRVRRRPRSAVAPDPASRWLQRESRIANPQRRPDYGYRQVIRSAGRGDDMLRCGPQRRDQRCRTGVVVVDPCVRLGQGVRPVVADLQAGFLRAVQAVVVTFIRAQLGMRRSRRLDRRCRRLLRSP